MATWMARRRRVLFPPVSWTSPEGVIAVGGTPDPETLKEAYGRGIFPWPHEGLPLLWFCPHPRFILVPGEAHVSRSLRKEMRRGAFEVRSDTAFEAVMRGCAARPRPGQDGTWITEEMIDGYTALHAEGLAHSIEAWQDGRLVGGLYGVSLGAAFFGESMYADVSNASKVCFATLLANLVRRGFELVDCQSYTGHLATFGAVSWPRARFLAVLKKALRAPTRQGRWTLDVGPAEAAEMFADRPAEGLRSRIPE
jgi:leucyl/phenylalanyl-tRNA--protein transferase